LPGGFLIEGFLQKPINDSLYGIGNTILLGIDLRFHMDEGWEEDPSRVWRYLYQAGSKFFPLAV
jgi:hypothetical protein